MSPRTRAHAGADDRRGRRAGSASLVLVALVAATLIGEPATAAPPPPGPTVSHEYPPPVNHPPAAPAGLSSPSAPTCGSSDNPVPVGAGTLRFTAQLSDPDGDLVNGFLNFWGANGHHPDAFPSGNLPSGITVNWTVPSGALQPNVVYGYDARAVDTNGAWGPWTTPRCYLVQDITPPDRPPVVTSADYPEDPDRAYGAVGRPGAFTMDRDGVADVSHFLYGSQDPPAVRADAGPDGTATVNVTPTTPGVNIFYARSVDIAGNPGPVRRYRFNVASPTKPVAYWRFNEGSGTTAADVDGRHDMTITGGSWVPGRPGDIGRAYQFDGADDHAQTSGPVIDTTRSFSVSAWANLQNAGAHTGLQTVVAPVGNQRSPFSLDYNNTTRRWELGLQSTDASSPADSARTALSADVVQPRSWYHLAASYDAETRQARLYVDGVLVDGRSHTVPWNAAGPLQVGRSKNDGLFGDHFGGLVDDVRVWDRVAQPNEILAIASDRQTSKIGATATSPGAPCRANQTPDKAVDGSVNDDSMWCTGDVHGRVLRLELATETTLRAVAVRHAGAGGETQDYNSKDFDIESSSNGADWTRIGTYRGNTGAHTVLTLPEPVRAAFVRLVVHTPAQNNDNAARIFEFEVYGSPWVIGNAALGKPATSATASCDASQTADRLTDGVVTVAGGWCAVGSPASAQVDLGSVTDIRWVVLRHAEAGGGSANQNTRAYEVHTSDNGRTWTTVALVQANNQPVSGHVFNRPITGRYVRVVITDASQDGETISRVRELEVYAPQ